MKTRTEHDSLGEKQIPAEAHWGIHTARAHENFKLTRQKVSSRLIHAMAQVKKAACLASLELKDLDSNKAKAILQACDEVIAGKFEDSFFLDALQGGAGTSTNMNVNEVIANRALEILGHDKGDYVFIHPIDHVNRHQSTNDVYPTSLRIAAIQLIRELSQVIAATQGVFQKKEKEFAHVVKIGRTEYQEAVPMTMGAEFGAFAEAISRDRWRTFKCEERLRVVNLGGTAIGTGLTAPRSYIFLVIEKLREVTGLGLSRADHVPGETAFADSLVEVSGILMAHACNLMKIANDLRLLALLGEIKLPSCQAGSSIMPGKVNPVILESVIQGAVEVRASHFVIVDRVSQGTLQINEFMPQIAFHLIRSLELLIKINEGFSKHAEGILALEKNCHAYVEKSPVLVTAFLPYLGYDKAAQLFKDYESSGSATIREFLVAKLGKELVDKALSPENLAQLGYHHGR